MGNTPMRYCDTITFNNNIANCSDFSLNSLSVDDLSHILGFFQYYERLQTLLNIRTTCKSMNQIISKNKKLKVLNQQFVSDYLARFVWCVNSECAFILKKNFNCDFFIPKFESITKFSVLSGKWTFRFSNNIKYVHIHLYTNQEYTYAIQEDSEYFYLEAVTQKTMMDLPSIINDLRTSVINPVLHDYDKEPRPCVYERYYEIDNNIIY